METIADLAARLKITLVPFDPDIPSPSQRAAKRGLQGPMGCAIFVRQRKVYVEEGIADEELLHEIVHVYVATPWGDGVSEICESWLLFAVERMLAEWLGIDKTAGFRSFQMGTAIQIGLGHEGVDFLDDTLRLRDLHPLVRHAVMSRAWSLADRLGLIGPLGEPTFKRPDWKQLGADDIELMNASWWVIEDAEDWLGRPSNQAGNGLLRVRDRPIKRKATA